MKSENPKKMNNRSRVALTHSNTEKIQNWRSQLCEEFSGIKVSESDLVNWAVESIGGELSKRQLDDIKSEYFDEVKQLEWLLTQARAARANDDEATLSKLMGSLKRPPKREKSSSDQPPDPSALPADSSSPSGPSSSLVS